MENKPQRWTRWVGVGFAAVAAFAILAPSPKAIPAFARKYHISCFTCHTVFPRLTKFGYEFKRLGYRMPPDIDTHKPPKKVATLDENIPWKLTNAAAVYMRTSVSHDTTTATGSPRTSASSANLDQVSILFGGSIPESGGFSYFGEYVAYQDGGSSDMERAKFDWTGGTVRNSYFVGLGKSHLVEGYSAADLYGLTDDDSALGFGSSSPNGIYLAQSTGMVEGGYTFMSPDYKYVVGLTAKVANGLDVNGNGIGNGSTYNHKDVMFDADFLIGDNGSVSAMYYNGRKDTIQNAGTPQQFTYVPTAKRWGLFGHYKFFDHLDVLAGYMGGREDWQSTFNGPVNTFNTKAYFGEVDYYIAQGLVVWGRYDKSNYDQPDFGLYASNNTTWMGGVIKTVDRLGNVKLYAQFIDAKGNDITGAYNEDKQAKVGLDLAW